MLRKDDFAKYTPIMTKKSNKGNKTFTAVFLFRTGNPNLSQFSLPWYSIFLLLDVMILKLRIILLTDWPKIILPNAHKTNN